MVPAAKSGYVRHGSGAHGFVPVFVDDLADSDFEVLEAGDSGVESVGSYSSPFLSCQ